MKLPPLPTCNYGRDTFPLSVDIAMAGRRADVDPVILSAGHRSPGKGHGSRGEGRTRSRRHQLRIVDSGRWGLGRGLELVLGTRDDQGEARELGVELDVDGLSVEVAGEIDGEGHGAAGPLSADIAMANRGADVDPVILGARDGSPREGDRRSG